MKIERGLYSTIYCGKPSYGSRATRKSPKSGLSHCAWKSRRSGGIPHSSHSSGDDGWLASKNKIADLERFD